MVLLKKTAGDARSIDRERLAAAIGAVGTAECELSAARAAAAKAIERKHDAQDRLEALRARDNEYSHGVRDFIASVAADSPCDVAELDRLETESVHAVEEEISREITVWEKTMRSCEAAIDQREQDLFWAQHHRDEAAKSVVRSSGAARALLSGLVELEAEVMRRRLGLHFLACADLISEIDKPIVAEALRETNLPGGKKAAHFEHWHAHAAYASWAKFVEALKQNAATPLPGIS